MSALQLLQPGLFDGRVVFVTGGGSGINLGTAKSFAQLGAKVCASVADVRDPDALGAAMARTRETLGPIDVLVCGAAGNFVSAAEGRRSSRVGHPTTVTELQETQR